VDRRVSRRLLVTSYLILGLRDHTPIVGGPASKGWVNGGEHLFSRPVVAVAAPVATPLPVGAA
jgi:hypothetical protein